MDQTDFLPGLASEIVDFMSEPVLILDSDNRVVYANPASRELFRLGCEELLAQDIAELIRSAGNSDVVQQLKQDGWGRNVPCSVRGEVPRKRYLSWQRLKEDGDSGAGVLVTFRHDDRDSTEQTDLLQAQKMAVLGQLVGGIAHDFNNLIGVFSGAIATMRHNLEDSEQMLQRLDLMDRCVTRATDLTRQLTGFARQSEIVFEPLDLREVQVEAQELLGNILSAEITLRCEQSESPRVVVGSKAHILTALLNLVVNARDVLKGPGTIEIRVDERAIESPEECAGGTILQPCRYWALSVIDDGPGVPVEDQKKIFQPFFTSGKQDGTGLGLVVVQRVMKEHRGGVKVYSGGTGGACFTLFFPVAENR